MYEDEFSSRLAKLRAQKGVSARDMSLSIGQNPGYIYNIESGKALPSMSAFFFICDYLGVTPAEFFETKVEDPRALSNLIADAARLNAAQIQHISAIIEDILNK